MYLWISTDCGSGSECPGMEAPLEAGTAQLMPNLLSDGNVNEVEDDETVIAHVDIVQCSRQLSYELGRVIIA